MTAHQKEYIRDYYRARRARLRAAAPDPETHPLRVWRKANGLSMAKTARLLEVRDTSIWNWENGLDPTPEWVLEVISDGMTDYIRRKLQDMERVYREQIKSNPIRGWRKLRDMSQAELAEKLGVSQNKLSAWETSRRPTPEWVLARLEEL